MICVQGTFDPFTQSELDHIRKLKKESGDVYVFLNDRKAVLSSEERGALIRKALSPFAHLHFVQKAGYGEDITDEETEKEVRSGYFRKAAAGTKTALIEKRCYLHEIVFANCKPKRAEHSLRVADTCVRLAQAWHMDTDQAWCAGMLHDVTKALSDEEGRKIISIYKKEWESLSPKVWHSFTASIWLKQNMDFHDQKILNAISHHTLGDARSRLAKILYIADKIEPGRGYDTTYHMALAEKDLDAAMELVRKEGEEYRKERTLKE